MEIWNTDIGNEYLEAKTLEKVYITAGTEFGDDEGHILIIDKELYGIQKYGLIWHAWFSACIRCMGLFVCKLEPDILILQNGNIYEYIAVYVDDLKIASKNPKSLLDSV